MTGERRTFNITDHTTLTLVVSVLYDAYWYFLEILLLRN